MFRIISNQGKIVKKNGGLASIFFFRAKGPVPMIQVSVPWEGLTGPQLPLVL